MHFSLPLLRSPEDILQKPFAVLATSAAVGAHAFARMATETPFVFAAARTGGESISPRMDWAPAKSELAVQEVVASI